MPSMLKTLSQDRAFFVQKRIEEHKSENMKAENYKSYAAKLPAMIVNNGLAATLAFMKQASGDEWRMLYQDLTIWLQQKGMIPKGKDLLDAVLDVDAVMYRHMTREALALAEWLKRLASVEFKDEK